MSSAFDAVDKACKALDMAWDVRCRDEDMVQRATENHRRRIDDSRRKIDDARRSVDEKAEQLKAISHLSALIAGFAMIVMVEIQLPDDLHLGLLVIFGGTSAGVVGLMLIAMLSSTMVLIAILKFDCKSVADTASSGRPPRFQSFEEFWTTLCEDDWQMAYQAFTKGVPLFMCVLAQLGWIIFHGYGVKDRNIAASIVTIVAALTSCWWFTHAVSKWGYFIKHSATGEGHVAKEPRLSASFVGGVHVGKQVEEEGEQGTAPRR
eukprot:CAMPEP_0118965562 /NCGR_PEP_ID=MMETSP1173-20130426/3101_1 /TAXON_ID=1034831 /ORGANISM="Rhizochromulina marina cf, Strain CCMP1243" /LENGTH=262 /DNA_ID=CAMNT_0006914207 /DNA_START=282 /DNA_END=1066 /DNA_ORIENTATION=+